MRLPMMMGLLALTGLAAAAPAWAQKVGRKAPDFNIKGEASDTENFSLEKHKNRIVVLLFFRSNDSGSVDALVEVNKIARKYERRGVTFLAYAPEAERERIENTMKSKEINITYAWGGRLHETYECPAYPHVYIIDTGGILVWHGHPGNRLEERIQSQMMKTPPLGSDNESLTARLKKADALLARKEFGTAYTIAKDVRGVAATLPDIAERAKALQEKIETAAKAELTRARELSRKEDYENACALLAMLSVRFEGTEIAREADVEIARLRGSGTVKSMIRKAIENEKGLIHNEHAAALEAQKLYGQALKEYEKTVKEHADTDAAKAAKAAIDKINADPAVQKLIKSRAGDEEAERWLDLGERFVRADLPDLAREQFERVIKEHPDSEAAKLAKAQLAKLPKGS